MSFKSDGIIPAGTRPVFFGTGTTILAGFLLAVALPAILYAARPQDDTAKAVAASATEQDPDEKARSKPERKPVYDEKADASQQISAALAKAKKENRRVLIQWGANWCGWCHLLHDCFLTNGEVRRKLMYEYDLVLVDVGHGDKNLELGEKYQADFAKQGLPFLTVLDGDGNVIANQETASLESKDKKVQAHDPQAVLKFLTAHQAEPVPAAEILQAGIHEARDSKRLVFLHFGAPWCGWCHRLEDWMARPEVHEILDAAFVDVKIDTDRNPGGDALLEEYSKGNNGGIPWFVFLDPSSGEIEIVADSTGPEGNVGFPYSDEEIAWFGKMLNSAKSHLTVDASTALTESLRANRERTEAERARAELAREEAETRAAEAVKENGGDKSDNDKSDNDKR